MASYITRRKRWFERTKKIDSTTNVSENILVDYLMGGAGISNNEKHMIKTVCGGDTGFENTSLQLRKQHARIHLTERRKKDEHKPTATQRKWRTSRYNTFVRKTFKRTAFNAEEEQDEEEGAEKEAGR